MSLNMGGFNNLDAAIVLAQQVKADVLVLSETWLTDHSTAVALRESGFRGVVALNRPQRVTSGRIGGGILVLSLNNSVTIRNVLSSPASGVLSVSASTPTSAPVLLTCCYVADEVADRTGIASTSGAHADIKTHAERLSAKYAEHLIIGDFNAHIGAHGGRLTSCKAKISARSRALIALIDSLHFSAVHGRSSRAITTSRPISRQVAESGGKEVDYVFSKGTSSSTQAVDSPLLHCWPIFTSHRPLVVDTTTASVRPIAVKIATIAPKIVPPRFKHPIYLTLSKVVKRKLRALQQRPSPSLHDVTQVFLQPAKNLLTARESDFCIIKQSYRNLRYHSRFSNTPIPSGITNLLRKANHRNLVASSMKTSPNGKKQTLLQEAETLLKKARDLRKNYLGTFKARLTANFERQRRSDPRRLFRTHKSLSAVTFDSTRPAGPKLEDFVNVLIEVYKERPPPPAASEGLSNAPSMPDGPAEYLQRPIHANEVYCVLFGPSKDVECRACPCPDSCRLCSEYNANLKLWTGRDDSPHPPPRHHPVLSASTAAGRDGLPAQVARWTLSGGMIDLPYRLLLCEIIAASLTDQIARGVASSDMAEMRTIPLIKELKPGQVRDIYNIAKSYRFLTIGNLFGKVCEMVLFARIYHWTQLFSLIGAENIGGLDGKGVDLHVLALRELVHMAWRKQPPEAVYVFFVDFHKAYDSVHPDLLIMLLKHMGIPSSLAAFLASIYKNTTTTLFVDGESTDPIKLHMGLGQGRVLSALFFVLFLESYLRTIKATPGLEGVSIRTAAAAIASISSLGYIDDVSALLKSIQQCELFLRITLEWSRKWGIPVSTGAGKTEILPLIPRPLRDSVTLPPSITVDGVTIELTTSYKYLGWIVDRDLSDSTREETLIKKMHTEYHSTISSVQPLSSGAPLPIVQFYKTFVASIPSTSAAIFLPSAALCNAVDELALTAARKVLPGSRLSTPKVVLWRLSGLIPFRFLALMHRIRLFLFLTDRANADCIAAKVYSALAFENHAASWHGVTMHLFREMRIDPTATARANPTLSRSDVARFLSRQCADKFFDSEIARSSNSPPSPLGLPGCRSASFLFPAGLPYPPPGARKSLGEFAAGTASILASCTDPSIPQDFRAALFLWRSGRSFLFNGPYSPECLENALAKHFPPAPKLPRARRCSTCKLTGHTMLACPSKSSPISSRCSRCLEKGHLLTSCTNASPSNFATDRNRVFGQLKNGSLTCPLCSSLEPLCASHLLACSNNSLSAQRNSLTAVLPNLIANLITRLERASNWSPKHARDQLPPPWRPDSWSEDAKAAKALADKVDWSSKEGLFLLFHLLAVEPWTTLKYRAIHGNAPSSPSSASELLALLSPLFDNTRFPIHRYRQLVSWWIRWAGAQTNSLFLLWKDTINKTFPDGFPIPQAYLNVARLSPPIVPTTSLLATGSSSSPPTSLVFPVPSLDKRVELSQEPGGSSQATQSVARSNDSVLPVPTLRHLPELVRESSNVQALTEQGAPHGVSSYSSKS